jgi:hypothetical protein
VKARVLFFAVFRRVRDAIDARIAGWLAALDAASMTRSAR